MLVALTGICVTGCKKDNGGDKGPSVIGDWHLVEIGAVSKSQEPYDISVYVSFSKDGTFELWQKLQDGPYIHYAGSWEQDYTILYGYYSDGTAFGSTSYSVGMDGENLTLTANNGTGEVTTYEKVSVPSSVKSSAVEAADRN